MTDPRVDTPTLSDAALAQIREWCDDRLAAWHASHSLEDPYCNYTDALPTRSVRSTVIALLAEVERARAAASVVSEQEIPASVYERCCRNDQWRGHRCQFHQGYEDGWEAAFVAVRRALTGGTE